MDYTGLRILKGQIKSFNEPIKNIGTFLAFSIFKCDKSLESPWLVSGLALFTSFLEQEPLRVPTEG